MSRDITKETEVLVKLFLNTNASNEELASITGIPSTTVGNRLTNEKYIKKIFSEETYDEVQMRLKNNNYDGKIGGNLKPRLKYNLDNTTLNVDLFYKDDEKKYHFLKNLALTYRVKFNTLSKIFGIAEDELYDNMHKYNSDLTDSFTYLNDIDLTNQEKAESDVRDFYKALFNSRVNKDREMTVFLLRKINDYYITQIRAKYNSDNEKVYLKPDEYESIVRFQIKYAYSQRVVSRIIGIPANTYSHRVNDILEDNDELKREYEMLADYNVYLINKRVLDARRR